MDLVILADVLEVCLKHGAVQDAHHCLLVSLEFLTLKTFFDVLAKKMFPNCFDFTDNSIMIKAQFIKNTKICLLSLLDRPGHKVGIEEVISVLDEGVAIDIIRGGQEEVVAVDQVIRDTGVGCLHTDEEGPAEVKQLPRGAGRPLALP